MKFSRRRFLGAVAAGGAGLAAPRALTADASGKTGLILPPSAVSRPVGQRIPLFARAMAALDTHAKWIPNRDTIGIVDFSVPSRTPRFHLLDVARGEVIATHHVAHGRGSDPDNSGWVERFSNIPGSNASSQGSFVTGETYYGKHGHSRRLGGLDPENCLARSRAIVIHAASYVGNAIAENTGRIGRSQGCFAVAPDVIDEVLARLGPGRLLFAGK